MAEAWTHHLTASYQKDWWRESKPLRLLKIVEGGTDDPGRLEGWPPGWGEHKARRQRLAACAFARLAAHTLTPADARCIPQAERWAYNDGYPSMMAREYQRQITNGVSDQERFEVILTAPDPAFAAVTAYKRARQLLMADWKDNISGGTSKANELDFVRDLEFFAGAVIRDIFGDPTGDAPHQDSVTGWVDARVYGMALDVSQEYRRLKPVIDGRNNVVLTRYAHPRELTAILADLCEEAGCADAAVLNHLRGSLMCSVCKGKGAWKTKVGLSGDLGGTAYCGSCDGRGWERFISCAMGCHVLDAILHAGRGKRFNRGG